MTMLEDYKANPTSKLAKMILQKVRNNRVTNIDFCSDLESEIAMLNNIQTAEEQEEQLEDNYTHITAIERKKETNKMHAMLMKIKEYDKERDD